MLVHDKTKIKSLSCDDCGDGFLRKSNLVDHKKNYHTKYDKTCVDAGIVKDEPFSLD